MTKFWYKLPVWVRQTLMEIVETVGVAVLAFVVTSIEGDATITAVGLTSVTLKAFAKYVRANPYINVRDYVNDHK